uniref:Uncharacterized protein n=1 Tax=Globisporangium ultimum (strain ATCC 200006 / CBS 805.95 / DAOM BR144) TaxID=431595 RepID=K3WRM9_GLOUD
MRSVSPSSADSTTTASTWVYSLQPLQPLPILDLSISVKSRFLSATAQIYFDRITRQKLVKGVAVWAAYVSYLAMLFLSKGVGCVAAVLALVLWLLPAISAFGSLRYDVVKLLLHAHDFWFATCINVSAFTVFGVLLGDCRAVAMVATCLGVEMTICIDANIRRLKAWFWFNILAATLYLVTWYAVLFMLVDRMRDFPLVQYKRHELLATAFVASGLLTIVAIFARNVYRRYDVVWKRKHCTVVECVTFRTNLKFGPQRQLQKVRASREIVPNLKPRKRIKYTKQIGSIDARNTLVKVGISKRLSKFMPSRCSSGPIVACLGVSALCVSTGSALYDLYLADSRVFRGEGSRAGSLIGLGMTMVYCGTCAAHYQRKLLRVLCLSFDFLFLSAQLTIVHFSACEFFQWGSATTAILTSWIWIHWVLAIDALPPVTKRKLGLRKTFTVLVLMLLIALSAVLIYLLVFYERGASASENDGTISPGLMYDRVIWETHIFGRPIYFRLTSLFFNCFATAFLLSTRLLWRLVWHPNDVLLVLNGTVEFETNIETKSVLRPHLDDN